MKTVALQCPHCSKDFEFSERGFSGGMAKTLVAICRIFDSSGKNWAVIKDFNLSRADVSKLLMWGFLQAAPFEGRQTKPSHVMPTVPGWNFACGTEEAPMSIFLHGEKAVGFGVRRATIRDVLKSLSLEALWKGEEKLS